jgi:hypothetical protein
MDVVIPYIESTSVWKQELRYALRGVQKHVKDLGTVHIIGSPPAWLTGVELHVKHMDKNIHNKEANIFRKVIAACQSDKVSDPFLFMNDDHFLLQDIGLNFPFYHSGSLLWKVPIEKRVYNTYQYCCLRTAGELSRMDYPILNFDTHVPIVIHKSLFMAAVESVEWDTEGIGLVMKSTYANQCLDVVSTAGLNSAMYLKDCKIDYGLMWDDIVKRVTYRPCFSIGDMGLNEQMKTFLETLYPKPSRYEKD